MFGLTRLTLRRARRERLDLAASSLTFPTLLPIVPLLAVNFALLTRFLVFRRFEAAIDEHLLAGLLLADIVHTVLSALHRFAASAGGLSWAGSLFLLLTAVVMLQTLENAFNRIWNVKRSRP